MVFLRLNIGLFKINLNKMITVTDNAKRQAIRLMEDEGKDGYFIRVGVSGGGCSGLMYQLTFDNAESEEDSVFENNGVKVVVNKKSYLYLIGTTLDLDRKSVV